MKKIFATMMTAALLTVNAHALEGQPLGKHVSESAKITAAWVAMPVATLMCLADVGLDRDSEDCQILMLVGLPALTATSTVLLKEVKASQPDALAYVTGAAPSPLLYDTVQKLQDFSSEHLGKEITFEEAVNDIIKNI